MKHDQHPTSLFDRVRAWVRGELAPAQGDALRGELERDAAAREFADDYRYVEDATRDAFGGAPASRVEFAQIDARIAADDRTRRTLYIRRAAAAAAIVFAAGAVWWGVATWKRSRASQEPLRLKAIPIAENPAHADEAPLDVPAYLASYEPTQAGQIQWIDGLEEGLRVARLTDRPAFVFGMFPTCPYCIHMQQNGLRDEGVLALVGDDFVPVRIDYSKLDEEAAYAAFNEGYPRFEVRDPEGELVHTFPGVHEAPAFVENLSQGLESAPRTHEPPPWSTVHELARDYGAARDAEARGREGEAYRAFSEVSRRADAGELARAAESGVQRVASAAREALLNARELAAADARTAERELEAASERFAGSPYAEDLEAARERLSRDGRFPELAGE